jgi:FAD:protein FMN transferase
VPPERQFGLRSASRRWWVLLVALVGLSGWLYAGPRAGAPSAHRFEGSTMGTTSSVILGGDAVGSALEADRRAVEALLAEIEASMSTWDPDSELSRFNRHRSEEPVTVSEDLALVLRMALAVHEASEGTFDVTVGPLVNAWGFGPDGRPEAAPDESTLSALRERVGSSKLELEGTRLRKLHPELEVDLSAIAKGHAVDRVATLLEARGHHDYLVEIGGELRGRGRSPAGRPFRVGIEEPTPDVRVVRRVVELDGLALATSGNYRNFFERDGRRYVHTLDPARGRPVAHDLLGVSVLHERCALADAWATALLAAGPDRAWALAQRADLDVLLLLSGEHGEIVERATPGFTARMQAGPSGEGERGTS